MIRKKKAVDHPGYNRTDRQQDKADNPERDQFGEQEQRFGNGRHVDLLDGSLSVIYV